MITGQQRVLRRLRQLFRAGSFRTVGVRIAGGECILYRAWDDRAGQCEAVYLHLPWLDLTTARQIAGRLLSQPAAITAAETYDTATNELLYVIGLDGIDPAPAAVIRRPYTVRWFNQQALAAGIGQQDNGFLTFGRSHLLPGD